MMNMNPIMVVILVDVLCIQLLKYHDNDDFIIYIQQLTKLCVTNEENMDDHKLQYFLNSFKRKAADWFSRYETIHPVATWNEVQCVFINQFSEICSKRLVAKTF